MTGVELLPGNLRRATEDETAAWLAGYFGEQEAEGSYETEEGLLVPDLTCHCGEQVLFDGTFVPARHSQCIYIP